MEKATPSSTSPPELKSPIILFGDSIAAGFGSMPGHGLSDALSRELGKPVINAGKNGDTTASAFARLRRDVLSKNDGTVIIVLGGNDLLRNIPLTQTIANLTSIITAIQNVHAEVIFVSEDAGHLPHYHKAFQAMADTLNVVYIPNALKGIFQNRKLMSDPIHPNDAGYEALAKKIVKDL